MTTVNWDTAAEEKFKQLIEKVPIFLRELAQQKISQKAEGLVRKESRSLITEKDMVDAFFAETPFGFHGPMKTDMESLGVDYTKYGYDR